MKIRRLSLLLAAWLGGVQAAPLLSSSVSFNEASRLYNYTYVIDTAKLPAAGFREFAILVNAVGNTSQEPWAVAHQEPTGWEFVLASGGNPTFGISGEFWMWVWGDEDVNPGGLMTFSFATPISPDTGTAKNYFIYSGAAADPLNSAFSVGRTFGPDLTAPPAVPEPPALPLWIAGAGVCWSASRLASASGQRSGSPRSGAR